MNTILIVEDDQEISGLTKAMLESHHFSALTAENGKMMDSVLKNHDVDLILLDIMLPEEDGLSICKRLRQTTNIPIIMVTALKEDIDRILGLELGADDYVAKPFNPRELVARIRAVLRRNVKPHINALKKNAVEKSDDMTFANGWVLNNKGQTVHNPDGLQVDLTGAEFKLLHYFLKNRGIVLNRDQILDTVQGRESYAFDRSVDIMVSRLRQKLGRSDFIKTVRGMGYVFTG